jgi:N-acetyl sugar amidotransferase
MRYCLRCCYPENTKPAIIFDDDGICSGCRAFEDRTDTQVDWVEREKEFSNILEEYKIKARSNGAKYDCIVPISGGKDSHFQVYILTQKYNIKPLLVTYNHSYNTEVGIRNLNNIVEQFDCDLIRYTTNPNTARKISKYMLQKVGDVTWHYHAGVHTFPIQVAVQYKIPLIVWGEHGMGFLFGMHNLDDKVEFTKKHRQEHMMRGFEPEDILDDPNNDNITETDLAPFYYPSDEELAPLGIRGIYLGNYTKWDQYENTKLLIEKYGFETFQERQTTFNLYEKVEDFFQDTHNYLKYLKFGYSRCTDHASIEIRHQKMTREEGIEMIRKHEYNIKPENLNFFLKFAQISEKEFLDSVEHLRDPDIWKKNSNGEWELLDWIGNHIDDEGVKDAKLPIKEKWVSLKSQPKINNRITKLSDKPITL